MIDVAIDARRTRRMSVGSRAYLDRLLDGVARSAPDLRIGAVGRGENFTWAEQVALPREIARTGARLVHFPTTFAPIVRRTPVIVTIHDLIHLRYPALFGRAVGWHYRLIGGPLARGAVRIIVDDPRTIADCERYLRVRPERCAVVPLGYDAALLADEPPLERASPFFFYAGNHRPHKNLATLFAAWAALPDDLAIDLIVTGPDEPAERARWSRGARRLIFAGDLSALDLRRHYRAATAYVHPALAEGFGLPMLEAAVVGTPVIASSDALPSIVAPYAASFAARDVAALTALLQESAASPDAMRRRASEGAAALRAYTWDRFAVATAAVYREVLGC